jgi:hypothetical protein
MVDYFKATKMSQTTPNVHVTLENQIEYSVPMDAMLSDRVRILPNPPRDVCDFLI